MVTESDTNDEQTMRENARTLMGAKTGDVVEVTRGGNHEMYQLAGAYERRSISDIEIRLAARIDNDDPGGLYVFYHDDEDFVCNVSGRFEDLPSNMMPTVPNNFSDESLHVTEVNIRPRP